jgi:hypothetical protein
MIEPWLESGWEDPFKEVSPRKNETSAGGAARVHFGSDPKRVAAFDQWKVQRNQWADAERPARAAMKIFEDFYELYGRMEREAERVEIVLGDGRGPVPVMHPRHCQALSELVNVNEEQYCARNVRQGILERGVAPGDCRCQLGHGLRLPKELPGSEKVLYVYGRSIFDQRRIDRPLPQLAEKGIPRCITASPIDEGTGRTSRRFTGMQKPPRLRLTASTGVAPGPKGTRKYRFPSFAG